MNDHLPPWSAWKTPAPSPYFDTRVWQKLEAARSTKPAPASWWERWAIAGALAGATALMLISLSVTPPAPAHSTFATITSDSLTHAYANALHRR